MIFLTMKKAFEVKQKTFFQVSQVLSFRLEKQISKNLADTRAYDFVGWVTTLNGRDPQFKVHSM